MKLSIRLNIRRKFTPVYFKELLISHIGCIMGKKHTNFSLANRGIPKEGLRTMQSYGLSSTLATVCTEKFDADMNYFPRLRIGCVRGYAVSDCPLKIVIL